MNAWASDKTTGVEDVLSNQIRNVSRKFLIVKCEGILRGRQENLVKYDLRTTGVEHWMRSELPRTSVQWRH
jgi:hypothetical protein